MLLKRMVMMKRMIIMLMYGDDNNGGFVSKFKDTLAWQSCVQFYICFHICQTDKYKTMKISVS